MKNIAQLYHNDFGVAFYWKKEDEVVTHRIQLVFRQTGFFLTAAQLKDFSDQIAKCAETDCAGCCRKRSCQSFLLKTPVPEVDLAVNYNEFLDIKDLVEGTLFKIGLYDYVTKTSLN